MDKPYKKYQCLNCDFVYDEAEGMPDYDISAGTRWEDLSDDWMCPVCGSEKQDFELVEDY
ncbi:MAG: rubredoxin [Spongiibacteraceae bacterium]|nr:rubredoxin [Spongiibacteraceae bacterium]